MIVTDLAGAQGSRFFLLYEEWDLAERAAARAECCVNDHLDAYCEARGRAPSVAEIERARGRRAQAKQRLHALQVALVDGRRRALVI
jgi:hypothetical protein